MSSPGGEYVSPTETNLVSQMMLDGHYSEALQGWDGIMGRDVNPDRYRLARGMTLLLLGDPHAALADFLEVRRKPAGPFRHSVPLVGTALWLQGELEAACQDWASEISQRRAHDLAPVDNANGVHVPALLWWASAHTRLERWRSLAIEELRGRARTKTCRRSTWPGPLAPFLLGRSSTEALLAAVPNPHPSLRARWLCQAHFYVGASALSRSDAPRYQEQLEQAVSQGNHSISEPEFHLALAELRRLGEGNGE